MSFPEMEAAFADFRRTWLQGQDFDIPEQTQTLARMLDFLHSSPQVFQREHAVGHFTGSALVVDAALQRVALTLHKKLGKWLQFGGHADGETRLHEVALREGEEESGMTSLAFFPYCPSEHVPFDLDIHEIPPWKDVPSHFHYDVIYLIRADAPDQLKASPESEAVSWFSLAEARELCRERNLQRCFAKLDWLRENRGSKGNHHPGTEDSLQGVSWA